MPIRVQASTALVAPARRWLAPILLPALLGLAATASGADLMVRVQDSTGSRLANAAVCAGTPARNAQFGAAYTDVEGRSNFRQIPATELALTVSKPGFRGETLRLSGVRFDRLLIVTLAEGGLGPECTPAQPRAAAVARAAIQVAELRIDGLRGADFPPELLLGYRLLGEANEFRVSEQTDFADAAWQPLVERPSYRLSGGGGRKTLYFQVRRHSRVDDGDLSIESNVASVEVGLTPDESR